MNTPPKDLSKFESLVEIMQMLRDPKSGCPWDLEQDHKSLTTHAMEEVCELIQAIENEDEENTIEELGDVLMQVLFHSQIGKENKRFDIYNVIEAINTKLVTRHPHVFGNEKSETNKLSSAKEVLVNWEKIKAKEKEGKPKDLSFGVPIALPALQRAAKIGKKTKKLKFDWESAKHALAHVESELEELKEAWDNNDPQNLKEEMGDLLFTIAQVARHLEIDPEQALRGTNQKVENRWIAMQTLCIERNLNFTELSTDDLNELWKEVKIEEKLLNAKEI